MSRKTKIGIVGTGFIASGLIFLVEKLLNYQISSILTRRVIKNLKSFPSDNCLTNSINELIDKSDLIVECSGSVIHASNVINDVIKASIPVVTMNAEFHITTGSYFVNKGIIREAEGDQPGCLAALRENILAMGFRPIVYGNFKGFLNHNPKAEDMIYWAKKNGISLNQTVSFTDGTKVQIEQAFIANAFNATIIKHGLIGVKNNNINKAALLLADEAKNSNKVISDYILSSKAPPGVFIVAEHDDIQAPYLDYYKMGKGPFYMLIQNFHLCHLEIIKTINRIVKNGEILLNNSSCPTISIAAIAKKDLTVGEKISQGIGSFQVRGEAVKIKEKIGHIPIGLLENAVVSKNIESGQLIKMEDVEIQENFALKAWNIILKDNNYEL